LGKEYKGASAWLQENSENFDNVIALKQCLQSLINYSTGCYRLSGDRRDRGDCLLTGHGF